MGLLGTLFKVAAAPIAVVAAAPVVAGGAIAGVGGAVAGAVVSGVIASKAIDTCEKVDKTMEEMKNIPKKND